MSKTSFPGGDLRARREELGVTLRDVSRKLSIPSSYLVALEEWKLSALPKGLYGMGFIKTYCEYLGLDPNRYADSLKEEMRMTARPQGRVTGNKIRRPMPWMEDLLTWAAIVGVLLFGWFAYTIVVRPQADLRDDRVQAGTVEVDEADTTWRP